MTQGPVYKIHDALYRLQRKQKSFRLSFTEKKQLKKEKQKLQQKLKNIPKK